jgi:hypothetical protein
MNPLLGISVLLFFCGCSRMTEESRETRVSTPEGEVVANDFNVDSFPQSISVVTGDQLGRLQALDDAGTEFVAHYVPKVTEPTLKDYDAAFRAWQLDDAPPYTEQQVVEIVGSYLGNQCVADFDMEWVTVVDEYGTDFAVRSKKVELMSFPFSTVLKRIEDKQYDFVYGVYWTIHKKLKEGNMMLRGQEE